MYRVVAGTQSLGLGLSASRDLGPVPQGAAPAAASSSTTAGSSTSAPAASGAGSLPPVRQSFRAEPNGHCRDYYTTLTLSLTLYLSTLGVSFYSCTFFHSHSLVHSVKGFSYLRFSTNDSSRGMARLLSYLMSIQILFAFLFTDDNSWL